MTTTNDCPGCTACIDPELLTDADRGRPACGSPMTPCIQESERDALARRITNLRAELRVCWDDLATHPADPAQLTARIDDLCGAARRLRGALATIDENPRPLVIDAPWIGRPPKDEAEAAARKAWARATLIMPWRFTVEYGPGTVVEPRTQPDGSICAGPWPVGPETITRTVWVRIHKHCGILAYLTDDRAELHPSYISSGDTPREAVVLAAQRAAGFGDVVKMRRFRSLRVDPVGPAEPEVCPRCGHKEPKPHAEAHLRMCGPECPCAGGVPR